MSAAVSSKIAGTWNDRTKRVNEFRRAEAELGLSAGDADFRRMAKRISRDLMAPHRVDLTIHFETKGDIEIISLRGKKGRRSFRSISPRQKRLPPSYLPELMS